ncbi:hypothetical protein ACFL2U_01965 [Patescibacteria group bacterium]
MHDLTETKKQELRAKIERVESKFTEGSFADLIKIFQKLKFEMPVMFIEQWLLQLTSEKIYTSYGLLAWLYYSIEDFDKAVQYSQYAARYFKDTEIWDTIIKNSLVKETIEGGLEDFAR